MKTALSLLFLFSLGMHSSTSFGAVPDAIRATQLAMAGATLSAKEAQNLEAALEKTPDDKAARIKLLGYYLVPRNTNESAKSACRKHVLWVIKNHPEAEISGMPYTQINEITDPDGYSEAKKLWLDQAKAHAKEPAILGHAARFFFANDRELAEDFLKQAQQLEPKDPSWPDLLGHLDALQDSKSSYRKALEQFEKAQSIDKIGESKFARLDNLAKSAYEAGDIDKASKYANRLLNAADKYPNAWNHADAIHHANIVLGRIALQNGDLTHAKQALLSAGRTKGSGQLNSFGPNMSLAEELLEKGEKDTVLRYFKLCRKFWKLGGERLDQWEKDVNAGNIPQFGSNLVY